MVELIVSILETLIAMRVVVVMLTIWGIYALLSGLLLKIIGFAVDILKWVWILVYKLINSLLHIVRHSSGKAFRGLDQTVADFFGGVYGFISKVKGIITNLAQVKRPFSGTVFIVLTVLAIWITLPIWLNIETNKNFLTAPYHKYIEIENKVLNMVFSEELY